MSKAETITVNMDDVAASRRLMQYIGGLRGLYDVTLRQRKRTRSLNANAYYHVAVCQPWLFWVRDQYGDNSITHEQAHEALKRAVLGTKDKVLETGEVLEIIPRTRDMDTGEFSEYVENAARFLAEFAGIVVIPSDVFFEERNDRLRKVG